jgi:hypothetical protein
MRTPPGCTIPSDKETYGGYEKSEYREELDPDPELTQMKATADKVLREKALRYNEGKLKWSMVHYQSLAPLVRVLMYGEKKYARDNWKKGLNREEILDSMQRHLAALIDGQEIDPESGEHHIGHLFCNCMFYSYFNVINGDKSSK